MLHQARQIARTMKDAQYRHSLCDHTNKGDIATNRNCPDIRSKFRAGLSAFGEVTQYRNAIESGRENVVLRLGLRGQSGEQFPPNPATLRGGTRVQPFTFAETSRSPHRGAALFLRA